MPDARPGKRLSVFVGEHARYHHHPLADAIVERARQEGLSGATVMRAIEGFGPGGRLKTTRLLSSSDDLPVVIQIVDEVERIERFLPVVEGMVGDGLITVEDLDFQVRGEPRPD